MNSLHLISDMNLDSFRLKEPLNYKGKITSSCVVVFGWTNAKILQVKYFYHFLFIVNREHFCVVLIVSLINFLALVVNSLVVSTHVFFICHEV